MKKLCGFFPLLFKAALPAVCLFISACTSGLNGELSHSLFAEDGRKTAVLKVTSWNVETFFDSKNDGREYKEFLTCEKWGKGAYEERLKRLCSVIKALDSDVFIMEEIENEGVLFDISNFLAGEWNHRKVYNYSCFAKDENSSIGCGLLSRYPLSEMSLCGLDVRTQGNVPGMRPIIRVMVEKGGKKLTLLVNHWKSMSGGQEKTEVWRNRQEGLLSAVMQSCLDRGEVVLAAGDFNRDVCSFFKNQETGQILMRQYEKAVLQEKGVEVKNPWFLQDGSLIMPGSYFFQGEWSRIDNFFYCGDCEILSFGPETEGEWCSSEDGRPFGYKIFTGQGYSDHLPLSCVIRF